MPNINIYETPHPPCSNSPSIYNLPRCFSNTTDPGVLRHHSRVQNPQNIPTQVQPIVSDHIRLINYQPDFSIIVSVHNHGHVMSRNIAAIMNLTQGIWQLVLVFDDCKDDSLEAARASVKEHVAQYAEIYSHVTENNETGQNVQQTWECGLRKALACGLHKKRSDGFLFDETNPADANRTDTDQMKLHSLLTEVLFIVQLSSVWETTSDNLGMAYATASKYFILVQADMFLADPGWNIILSRPTEMFADIFSVSARCAHSFWGSEVKEFDGRCLAMDDMPTSQHVEEFSNRVYIRGTVNRGPLLLRSDHMIALGLFDEQNFLISSDDHDLMARALVQFNWRAAGYFALRVIAPYKDGTSHKEPSFFDKLFRKVPSRDKEYEQNRLQRANHSEVAAHQRAAVLATRSEIRYISNEDIQRVTDFWHQRLSYTLCCV